MPIKQTPKQINGRGPCHPLTFPRASTPAAATARSSPRAKGRRRSHACFRPRVAPAVEAMPSPPRPPPPSPSSPPLCPALGVGEGEGEQAVGTFGGLSHPNLFSCLGHLLGRERRGRGSSGGRGGDALRTVRRSFSFPAPGVDPCRPSGGELGTGSGGNLRRRLVGGGSGTSYASTPPTPSGLPPRVSCLHPPSPPPLGTEGHRVSKGQGRPHQFPRVSGGGSRSGSLPPLKTDRDVVPDPGGGWVVDTDTGVCRGDTHSPGG